MVAYIKNVCIFLGVLLLPLDCAVLRSTHLRRSNRQLPEDGNGGEVVKPPWLKSLEGAGIEHKVEEAPPPPKKSKPQKTFHEQVPKAAPGEDDGGETVKPTWLKELEQTDTAKSSEQHVPAAAVADAANTVNKPDEDESGGDIVKPSWMKGLEGVGINPAAGEDDAPKKVPKPQKSFHDQIPVKPQPGEDDGGEVVKPSWMKALEEQPAAKQAREEQAAYEAEQSAKKKSEDDQAEKNEEEEEEAQKSFDDEEEEEDDEEEEAEAGLSTADSGGVKASSGLEAPAKSGGGSEQAAMAEEAEKEEKEDNTMPPKEETDDGSGSLLSAMLPSGSHIIPGSAILPWVVSSVNSTAGGIFPGLPNPFASEQKHVEKKAVEAVKPPTQSPFSFRNPDPSQLVWDTKRRGGFGRYGREADWYEGWLKVPLVHDPHLSQLVKSPSICLRVRGVASDSERAPLGPLFLHCGGPGSGHDCVNMAGPPIRVSSQYDQWSISQRGINARPRGEKLAPCPFEDASEMTPLGCNSLLSLDRHELYRRLGLDANKTEDKAVIDEFVTPLMNGAFPALGLLVDQTMVQYWYRIFKQEAGMCYHDKKFKLKSPFSDRVYNALDYVSTMDLANDIDIFRAAIGAEKISLWGMSYGTSVAANYATVFPTRVNRLVLDGNVPPYPDVHKRATEAAMGAQSVWEGLSTECDNTINMGLPKTKECPAAPAVTAKLMKVINSYKENPELAMRVERLTRTILAEKDALEAPVLFACIEAAYTGKMNKGCSRMFIGELPEATPPALKLPNATVPNATQLLSFRDTLEDELDADHKQQQAESNVPVRAETMGIQHISAITAILGLDCAGRVTERGALQWWEEAKDSFPLGTWRGLLYLVGIGTWPAQARPQPPFGTTQVSPVIVGNLYDMQTSYGSTQWMREQFPSGSLMTWQGYGHCLSRPANRTAAIERFAEDRANGKPVEISEEAAKFLCAHLVYEYLLDGTHPMDGHTCKRAGPMDLSMDRAIKQAAPYQ